MGTNIPAGRRQKLEWIEGLIAQWSTNQAAIGLTSASVIDLAGDIANTRAAFTTVETVRADSKAKTTNFYIKADAMHVKASDMVQTIKAFAENSNTPGTVYSLAGITPADPRSPVAPPAQPIISGITLNSDGSVTVAWDGTGPTGTNYLIRRKNAGETAYTLVGQAGPSDKAFTDATIPALTSSASFTVQAVRGDDESLLSPAVTVQFGIGVAGAAAAAA